MPLAATAAAILVFAVVVAAVSLRLRTQVRDQIVARDAEVLYPVALMEISRAEDDYLSDPLAEVEADLLEVVLNTSELKGVLAIRIFDSKGKFAEAVPGDFLLGELSKEELENMGQMRPISRYHPEGRLEDYFIDVTSEADGGGRGFPLLEVIAPLHRADSAELLGIAHYLIDGQEITNQFAALDSIIWWQAGAAFATGSVLLMAVFLWAFGRLRKAYEQVEERGQRLLAANAELAMMAKTSAIGAVASHLVHGLKNPLSGLQEFVGGRDAEPSNIDSEEWQAAKESTRRMQEMIGEIVEILREENIESEYSYTLGELKNLLAAKAEPAAKKAGVHFSVDEGSLNLSIDSRRGNLLLLILMNLVQNAIEATPEGKGVRLVVEGDEEALIFRVEDSGIGVSERMIENLFSPCNSTKPGGSGIGLAISKQLARHIGGELSLEKNDSEGAQFLLTVNNPTAGENLAQPIQKSCANS